MCLKKTEIDPMVFTSGFETEFYPHFEPKLCSLGLLKSKKNPKLRTTAIIVIVGGSFEVNFDITDGEGGGNLFQKFLGSFVVVLMYF